MFFDHSTLTACVKRCYVPHLKGLISGKVEFKDQGHGSTIIMGHALLNRAVLLHIMASIRRLMCNSTTGVHSNLHQLVNKLMTD